MALTNLINADKVSKMNKKPVGLKTIDIDDIEVNRHNQFDINGIDELKSSILEYGLRKPLDVYKIGDRYRISDGERRYTALKELVDEGKIEPEVYCIIYEAPESELNDRLRLILGNGTRIMSELDKIKIVAELLDIYKQLDPKPKGNKRDWIAPFIGAKSGKTVQKYINAIEKKEECIDIGMYDEDKRDSCKNKEYGLSELFSDYNKLLKQIDKINKKVENTSIYHKKIAESDDRDITVEDSLINIHNVIGKFSRCIQISIEIDEQNNDENVLDGQMSIDEI